MIKFILIILFSLFTVGCTFSKDPTESVAKLYTFKKSDKNVLTKNQQNLLNSIEFATHQEFLNVLGEMSAADSNFEGESSTPAGLAIKFNKVQILEEIIKRNIDPLNIGSFNKNFDKIFFNIKLNEILISLNHPRAASELNINPTDTELLYISFIEEKLESAFAESGSISNNAIGSSYLKEKLGCAVVESFAIFQQLNTIEKEFDGSLKSLNETECSNSLDHTQIEQVYQAELIRQFQNYFNAPSILPYLARHKSFRSPLWNIDNSGIYVAPSLLLRTAYEYGDTFKPRVKCKSKTCPNYRNSDIDNRFQQSVQYFNSLGLAPTEKELIYTQAGKIIYTFNYFPVEGINDSYNLHEKIAAFMHGQSDKNSERTSWDIGAQIMEDGVVD
ncbi:hypothetical protein [Bdellovibrio reynosensis]|uniref:Uncharacterized protein n=1 Tax=Bdellovibrio reynosensis TaxID=2835041 RepID=A0ABY4C7V4_9BACT|nr:hypothetical protein [Bdellovibrio reynosensis]UOF00804.1 hypothetical protein MNR06_13965 [Bdellovibrio reynosensis]